MRRLDQSIVDLIGAAI